MKNSILICGILGFSFCSPLFAGNFADVGLSSDPKALVVAHEKSFFPQGASTQTDGVVGLPDVLISTVSASVKASFFKRLSPSEAVQSVVLTSGDNVIATHSGWEYENTAIRFVHKGNFDGSTDLEKAANAVEMMNKLGLFPHPWPWNEVPKVLRNPLKKGEVGYLITKDDPLNPQVIVIRVGMLENGTESFVEIGFVQGPL
jgi:hypothetical protein